MKQSTIKKTYKEEFKVACLNKISFGYIAVGYILNIWGDYGNVCKIAVAVAIILFSAAIVFVTYCFVFLWLKCSKKINRKLEDDDLKRLGLKPDMECKSFEIPKTEKLE